MDCQKVRQMLELFALEGLSAWQQAAVAEHLHSCGECRALARRYELLTALLRMSAAPPDFEEGMWPALRGEVRRARPRLFRRRVVKVGAALAAFVLVVCALWPLMRPDSAAPEDAARRPVRRWTLSGLRTRPRSPAYEFTVAGHRLFALCEEGDAPRVCAFDATSGQKLWQSAEAYIGYLAADAVGLYALRATANGRVELVAMDCESGRVLWRREAPVSSEATGGARPLPLDGERLCWTAGELILVLEARTGRVVWRRRVAGEGALSRPVRDGARLLVATGGALHGFRAATGERLWRRDVEGGTGAVAGPLLAAAAGRAYLVQRHYSPRAAVCCVDLATGRTVWRRRVGRASRLLPAGGAVYVRGEQVLALDGSTGQPLWKFPADGCGALTADRGTVRFVDTGKGGRLVALDARTGRTVWEMPGVKSCDPFVTTRRTGYLKTGQGSMLAIVLPEELRS